MAAGRGRITPSQRKAASRRIHRRLFQLSEFKNAGAVHCFISLPEEVDTEIIFQNCWAAGKKTVVPIQLPEGKKMGMAERRAGQPLVEGALRILEPAPEPEPEPMAGERREIAPDAVELVLVPGLAFDRSGGRLGHGKGYYDLFLRDFVSLSGASREDGAKERPFPYKIALAFDLQITQQVPTDSWDVKMDMIITDQEIILPFE